MTISQSSAHWVVGLRALAGLLDRELFGVVGSMKRLRDEAAHDRDSQSRAGTSIALRGSVLKSMLGGLCVAVCALPRLAAAQSSDEDTPIVLPPPPPPPPGVTPEPQPREEAAQPRPKAATQAPLKTAPPLLSDTNAALASGGREPIGDWQPLPPRAATDAASPTKPIRTWYGWQMLATDAISYSLIGIGMNEAAHSTSDGGNGALVAGLLGYAFAPPIIHLVHRRPAISAASLGVRFLVPAATLVIGAASEDCSSGGGDYGNCTADGAAFGLIIGFVLASAIDAGLFAWDKPVPPAVNARQFGFSPVLSRDGRRAELRAFGTF